MLVSIISPFHAFVIEHCFASAAVIIIGAMAAFSLLIRHWTAIEASTPQQPAEAELAQPLMTEVCNSVPSYMRSLCARVSMIDS